jgi:hypothetical protein
MRRETHYLDKRSLICPMSDIETPALHSRLAILRQEHRDLDMAIAALSETPVPDQLQLVRFKRRKLRLKDEIARIEDQLVPDIIA